MSPELTNYAVALIVLLAVTVFVAEIVYWSFRKSLALTAIFGILGVGLILEAYTVLRNPLNPTLDSKDQSLQLGFALMFVFVPIVCAFLTAHFYFTLRGKIDISSWKYYALVLGEAFTASLIFVLVLPFFGIQLNSK